MEIQMNNKDNNNLYVAIGRADSRENHLKLIEAPTQYIAEVMMEDYVRDIEDMEEDHDFYIDQVVQVKHLAEARRVFQSPDHSRFEELKLHDLIKSAHFLHNVINDHESPASLVNESRMGLHEIEKVYAQHPHRNFFIPTVIMTGFKRTEDGGSDSCDINDQEGTGIQVFLRRDFLYRLPETEEFDTIKGKEFSNRMDDELNYEVALKYAEELGSNFGCDVEEL